MYVSDLQSPTSKPLGYKFRENFFQNIDCSTLKNWPSLL